jgi:hypothetical protein
LRPQLKRDPLGRRTRMKSRAVCTKCGKGAFSEEQLARAKVSRIEFPPFPPNICPRCAFEDPAIRKEFDAWQARMNAKLVVAFREAVARSLEKIDRFVDGLR